MTNPRRIAFVLSSLKFGGGERVALSLAKALKARGYAVDFVLMTAVGELLDEASDDFTVVDLACDRTWKLPFKLMRYMRRVKPAAVISSFWKLNLCTSIARCAAPGIRVALWEHSQPSESSNSPTWLYAISASLFYRLATAIVAVSSGVAADMRRITIGLGGRIVQIPNPIPPPVSPIQRPQRAAGRTRLIWVGRLEGPKNPLLTMDAMGWLPRGKYSLTYVGDGSLRPALERRRAELGLTDDVSFAGYQSHPYVFLAEADILVLSSDREGLGNVLVEALWSGLGIATTDCGLGIRDVIGQSEFGTIASGHDAQALGEAIEREAAICRDPDVQIAAARRFDPDVIADRFLAALRLCP